MPSKVKRKSVRGGKYVGEGTYGCVFTPPIIPLNTEFKENETGEYVSKVLDLQSSRTELNIQQLLKAVDPANNFFLTYANIYPLSTFKKTDQDGRQMCLPKCGIKSLNKQAVKETQEQCIYEDVNLVNITYKNGGKDLGKCINNDIKDLSALFKPFFGLICGLNVLLKTYTNNTGVIIKDALVHADIKIDNILYDVPSNKLRYIDFGLSLHATELFKSQLFTQDFCYREHPFDFYLFEKAYNNHYQGTVTPIESKMIAMRNEFVAMMTTLEATTDVNHLNQVQRQIAHDILSRVPNKYTDFLINKKAEELLNFLDQNNIYWQEYPVRTYIATQYYTNNHLDVLLEFKSFIAFIICTYNDREIRHKTSLRIIETFDTFSLGKLMMECLYQLYPNMTPNQKPVFEDFAQIVYHMKKLNPYMRISPKELIYKYRDFLLKHRLADAKWISHQMDLI
jgi:serine/threonine protein kinase